MNGPGYSCVRRSRAGVLCAPVSVCPVLAWLLLLCASHSLLAHLVIDAPSTWLLVKCLLLALISLAWDPDLLTGPTSGNYISSPCVVFLDIGILACPDLN